MTHEQSIVDVVRPDFKVADLDISRRFVRITGEHKNGFVEFDFAIGEPEIFFEMILTHVAFEEFCQMNNAEILATDYVFEGTPSEMDWRMSQARDVRIKSDQS